MTAVERLKSHYFRQCLISSPSVHQDVARALEAASLLGCDPTLLTASLASARERDADLVRKLQSLASGSGCHLDFDLESFQAASQRGMTLGLKGDVSAVNLIVERRKSALVMQIERKAGSASASELQGERTLL